MKKRIALLLILTMLLTALLTACAGTEETTVTETETVTETGTETEQITETEAETETETEAETEPEDTETTVELSLPENSVEPSNETAIQLLEFCSGYNEKSTAVLLNNAGFEILFAKNYDKPYSDTSHTCAYTVAKGKYIGKSIYIIVIRGTSGGEWYSNFDFAPSHDNDTKYAECFYMAAQDIYLSVKEIFDEDPGSYKVVCGHSRGAAASNLLGVTLDNAYDKSKTYVYTFATPNTVRGEEAEKDKEDPEKKYNNIFNYINPADTVAYVPLEAHGFSRAGIDIMLGSEDKKSDIIKAVESLSSIAPDIKSYYEDKHSLTGKGLSDDGMSVFDVLKLLAAMFAADLQNVDLSKFANMSPESDLYSAMRVLSEFSDTSKLLQIGSEHAVSTYMRLICALSQPEQ